MEDNISDESRKYPGISWSLFFVTTCSSLWYCRNLFIFEGNNNTHMFLLAREYDYYLNLMDAARKKIPNVTVVMVAWIPPPRHWIKINTDGSFISESEVATCGGIARNYEGNFLTTWTINLGCCSITVAKL